MHSVNELILAIKGRLAFRSRQSWSHVLIVFLLTVVYIITFPFFYNLGGPVSAALIAVPVAAAGWFFGTRPGLLVGILGIALSALLLAVFAVNDGRHWLTWIANGWPGNLMVIMIGYVTGRLQEAFARQAAYLEELRSRERYLTLVNMTTRDVLTSQKIEEKYSYLLDHLVNLFVADYGYFVRWDSFRNQAVLIASTLPLEEPLSGFVLNADEAALSIQSLETGKVQVVESVPHSLGFVAPSFFGERLEQTQSLLVIPLAMAGKKLGAAVIGYNSRHQFTAREIGYAEFAASQFALAVWTIWQELEIQTQIKETNALVEIERALSESEKVGIESILQLIVDSAKELILGAESAVLHMLDSEQQILQPRAVTGSGSETRVTLNMRPGEGIAGEVIATRRMISVSDTQVDEHFINGNNPLRFRSLIVAPIQSNERCVGTISVQSSLPYAFTPDDGRLLDALGKKAAVAIENANLLETTRQDLKEINALYRISRSLVPSLDPGQLMKDVVELLHKNFGYYQVQTYVIDPATGDAVANHGCGRIHNQLCENGFRLPVGSGIVGHTIETRQPFLTNNVDEVIFFVPQDLLPETQSELTVPIMVEDRVVGVLDIQQAPPGRLTPRDLQLMVTVTDQLAVVLQKANLYTDLQSSLRQEKETREQLMQSERLAVVGRLLASVSHELNNPLQVIQNSLFLLKEEERLSAQGRQDMEIILSETERMSFLLNRLRATYRPARQEDLQDTQLNTIIEDVSALTATHMRHQQIAFEFHPDPDLPFVACIPDQLRQVVLNLIMNAVEAMHTGGCLTIATRFLAAEARVLMSVADTGPGISPEILPHIFEPFTTGKETGTGLGLSITYDIIHQYRGEIQATNNPGGGAIIYVWLPVKGAG